MRTARSISNPTVLSRKEYFPISTLRGSITLLVFQDRFLNFHPGKVRRMESVADYAYTYESHIGLPGEFLKRIVAWAMDLVTAAGREGRGRCMTSS